MDWLKKHVKEIESTNSKFKEQIAQIEDIKKEVFNEFHEWTPLKLIFLNYVLDIYTAIIPKYFKHVFYVDLFAGSGINKTKTKKDTIIGSPFIATLKYGDKFDKFFFVELDKKYAKTLNLRLDSQSIENN